MSWVRAERNRCAFSQAEFGRRVGVDAGTVSRWERGIITPHLETFRQICALVGADPTVVLDTVDLVAPNKPPGKSAKKRPKKHGRIRGRGRS